MVRAAVSGAINYTGADPQNRQWRIRHLLLLTEMERREDYALLSVAHKHWLALLSHGNLTEDSFKDVKTRSGELLRHLQRVVFPWLSPDDVSKTDEQTDTILDSSAQALIKRYRELHGNNGGT
ncbi:hypothetical protein EBZ80_27175 [bacterium]|jgi:hypothetical protein|nr:hypothetical protein [Betaproteobacteria bacterium]NDE18592.1 hypothetical protein [bacterium]